MVLSRLDIVKDFIDYLTTEYNKEVYRILRENNSPKEIFDCWEWRERNYFKTTSGSDEYLLSDSFIGSIMYEYEQNNYYQKGYSIECGAEQIAFIFSDEVYKISSNDTGGLVNNFICSLNNRFTDLFLYCDYLGFYKDCYIYKQTRVEEPLCSEDYINKAKAKGVDFNPDYYYEIRSEGCRALIAIEYGEDFLAELCESLADSGFNFDIHSDNYGIGTGGWVKIFDPIYTEEN